MKIAFLLSIFALCSCALKKETEDPVNNIISLKELSSNRSELTGKRVAVDAYISYADDAGPVDRKYYFYLIYAEPYRKESGEVINRCSSDDNSNFYIGKLGGTIRSRSLDGSHVIVSGVFTNNPIEVPYESITFSFPGSLDNARIEKIFNERCERFLINKM